MPRDAWLAWRSDVTGESVADLAARDDALSDTENPFDPTHPDDVRLGALVFQNSCVVCHGTEANNLGPGGEALLGGKDFTSGAMRTALRISDDLVPRWYQSVSEGRVAEDGSAAMPPMKYSLTKEQRWLAVTWLASSSDAR